MGDATVAETGQDAGMTAREKDTKIGEQIKKDWDDAHKGKDSTNKNKQ